MKSAVIVGAGFGGLGAAALLGRAGYQVTVLEKNEIVGGRAGVFEVVKHEGEWSLRQEVNDKLAAKAAAKTTKESKKKKNDEPAKGEAAFRFDMGPSWYLMPDVFEHFFGLLGEKVEDHLDLARLAPSYRIFYKDRGQMVDMYSDLHRDLPTVEALEPGAGKSLERYLAQASYQYNIVAKHFMYKNHGPGQKPLSPSSLLAIRKLNVLSNMHTYVSRYFKTDAMRKLLEYPLAFLGANPKSTSALYNILSHIDYHAGVHYPRGGMYKAVEALQKLGEKHNVSYRTNTPVARIIVEQGTAVGVELANGEVIKADLVISNADRHHTEQDLLEPAHRSKGPRYWQKRTMAPSALLIYLGVKGKLPTLSHHNILSSKDWQQNISEVFHYPIWPSDPSLYICNPSKSDPTVAPKGFENLFIMVPIAANLDYNQRQLEAYADKVLENIESSMKLAGLRKRIIYRRLFSVNDFESRYNSHQGSALGLAHTLRQTGSSRPANINKKVSGLYYVGADTNPGIGLPATLVSAELLFKRLIGDKSAKPLTPEQVAIATPT